MDYWRLLLYVTPLLALLFTWWLGIRMLGKLVPPPGMDMRIAKKQAWWDAISHIVDTDEATQKRLVENVYENVSEAKLDELKFVVDQITAGADIPTLTNQIAKRQALLEYYRDPKNIDIDTDIGGSNEG